MSWKQYSTLNSTLMLSDERYDSTSIVPALVVKHLIVSTEQVKSSARLYITRAVDGGVWGNTTILRTCSLKPLRHKLTLVGRVLGSSESQLEDCHFVLRERFHLETHKGSTRKLPHLSQFQSNSCCRRSQVHYGRLIHSGIMQVTETVVFMSLGCILSHRNLRAKTARCSSVVCSNSNELKMKLCDVSGSIVAKESILANPVSQLSNDSIRMQ
ncbi:hypothetical protein J3F84DRAFT_360739 [Trichoderma pleuroticola]